MKVGIRICIATLITGLVFLACSPNEHQQRTLENSTPETVDLLVSLGGSSRTERFLGTFDEIRTLTLDLTRNFDNREVVSDFPLTRDNVTGRWAGTLNNLIVSFDYTITGHAYKCTNCDNGSVASENQSHLEIFRGETQHTVTSGTNALALRLTPLLDNRELSVPRITRINRPFQLEKTDNASISVSVTNSDLQPLQFRFRSVDADTSLPLSEAEGGSFSPDKGTHEADNSSSYPDLATTYTAPDLISVQNLNVRVSNDLEIGVSASFKTYVTGPIDSQTTVNTNPVVETISGERAGDNELKWTVLVSDDDPFDTLVASWTYQDPETGATRTFDNSTYTDLNDGSRSDVGVGSISAVMQGYQDSDAGMLRVTICETNYTNHTGSCVHGQEGSTSVELELVAGAYRQPVICDGDSCSSLNFEGNWSNNCRNGYLVEMNFSSSQVSQSLFWERKMTRFSSDDGSCSGAERHEFELTASFQKNGTTTLSGGIQAEKIQHTLISKFFTMNDEGTISYFNENNFCGYSDWSAGVAKDVLGCDNFGGERDSEVQYGLAYITPENTLRLDDMSFVGDDGYPIKLSCFQLRVEGDNTSSESACNYDIQSSGLIKDTSTGLKWQREDDSNQYNFEAAKSYCEDLTIGSEDNLRLPEINDLITLVNFENSPTIDSHFFENIKNDFYWSSTEHSTFNSASGIDFGSGTTLSKSENENAYVLCVNGCQSDSNDNEMPILNSVSFSTTNLNVSEDNYLTIYIDASDDCGIDQIEARLHNPRSLTERSTGYTSSQGLWFNLNNDGLWEATHQLNSFSEAGTWGLDEIQIRDHAGNTATYSLNGDYDSSTNNQFYDTSIYIPTIDVTGTTVDDAPPNLTSVSLSPSSVGVGEDLTVKVGADDSGGSGVGYIAATLYSPSRVASYYESTSSGAEVRVHLNYNSSSGLYEGTVTAENYLESGTWRVGYINMGDQVDNFRPYNSTPDNATYMWRDYDNNYNIDTNVTIVEFELTGTTPDTVPPTIQSVSLNTNSIPESGGTLTVEVEGFDEYSGFDDSGRIYMFAGLRNPYGIENDNQYYNSNITLRPDSSGTGSILIKGSNYFSTAETGTWDIYEVTIKDRAGNAMRIYADNVTNTYVYDHDNGSQINTGFSIITFDVNSSQ